MKTFAALAVMAVGLCLCGTASARADHYGIGVELSGRGSVKGCDNQSNCISCPPACFVAIATTGEGGTGITLTPIPDPGVTFAGWAGDCSGTDDCNLDANGPHVVSAYFGGPPLNSPPPPPPKFPLTISKQGTGSGYVGGGGGIDCGNTCSVSEMTGTQLQLTAVPDASSDFVGWSGTCSGTGPCTVAVSAPTTVGATFDLLPPKVTVFPSNGVRGEPTKLRFVVKTASGQSQVQLVVVLRHKVIARFFPSIKAPLNGVATSVTWIPPRTVTPGLLKFCVSVTDPVAQHGASACGPLKIAPGKPSAHSST